MMSYIHTSNPNFMPLTLSFVPSQSHKSPPFFEVFVDKLPSVKSISYLL